jgi:formate dehydrogenase subunit delta
MDVNKLVRMANQIAANLDYGKDREKAIAGTVDHLKRFWTPDMRRLIIEHYREGSNGSSAVAVELSYIAARAVGRLAEEQVAA